MTYEELKIEWDSVEPDMCCHTSGSTGTPTLIKLPKKQMTASALRTCAYFGINRDSLLYSCIAPDFIGGKMMLIRALTVDCSLRYETPSNRPLHGYSGGAIDLLSIVPSQMIYILDNIQDMPSIKNILIGGAAIQTSLRIRISESKFNCFESYGMTETSSHIALRKIDTNVDYFNTLPGITVFDAGNSRLGIRIPNWQDFITNDIAEIKSQTEFKILGRVDNVINTGGKKVNPELLESKLSTLFDFDFYISSIPDEKWTNKIVLVAERPNITDEQIITLCRSKCDKHEVPKAVISIENLPRTVNGKIKRNNNF